MQRRTFVSPRPALLGSGFFQVMVALYGRFKDMLSMLTQDTGQQRGRTQKPGKQKAEEEVSGMSKSLEGSPHTR